MNKLVWVCLGVAVVAIVRDQGMLRTDRSGSDSATERGLSSAWLHWGTRTEASGFVEIGFGRDQPRDTVLVIAATNCPSEGSQRAEALAQSLREQGIPVERIRGFGLDIASMDAVQLAAASRRMKQVFDGPTPIVVINAMGCANPSLEQVVAEYRAQTSR